MDVLVIGGTGFIGSHLVRLLAQAGHSVRVFHRGKTQPDLPAEHIHGDRRDLPKLRLSADIVVDLILASGKQAEEGWASWRAPRGYVENVAAALALAATDERATGRIYNVAEWPAYSELDWAHQDCCRLRLEGTVCRSSTR
jgi:uncharacterized protein YbjT (DUF2867 family)